MRKILLIMCGCFYFLSGIIIVPSAFAQGIPHATVDQNSIASPTPSLSPTEVPTISQMQLTTPIFKSITQPEEQIEKKEILALFAKRPAKMPTVLNFAAFFVQYAITIGVPANTVILILLLPLLATIVAFTRHVIGLPSLGMLVAISFSITILTIGIAASMVLLVAILLASTFARIILKRIRIMQLPKMALSVFVVSIFVFIVLIASGSVGIISAQDLSIFPVLLLILLGERIVALQLERNAKETFLITIMTLLLGFLGFLILSFIPLRKLVLVYPEVIFLLIPINILLGRYFGLRVTEYFRFKKILKYGS